MYFEVRLKHIASLCDIIKKTKRNQQSSDDFGV